MFYLSLFGVLSLVVYMAMVIWKHGLPEMVSSTYYQGGGIWFSVVMWIVSLSLMVPMLDSGIGIQAFAFLCGASILFVGSAPNFLDEFEMPIHKGAAIISAIACIGWCLSANWIPTAIIVPSYAVYLLVVYIIRKKNKDYNCHTWLIAELLAFADTFITYWSIL